MAGDEPAVEAGRAEKDAECTDRPRVFARGEPFEGEREESVPNKERGRLVVALVNRRLATTEVGVVKAREVVVNERSGVHTLDGNGGIESEIAILAPFGGADREQQARTEALATGEQGVADGRGKTRRGAPGRERLHGGTQLCFEALSATDTASQESPLRLHGVSDADVSTPLRDSTRNHRGDRRIEFAVNPRDQAVVVGAGVAGMVAAIDLARAGFGVTVLEAGATAGGKLAIDTLEFDGKSYAIDCGPTVLTMAWVFEELFERCGERLRDHVTMHAAPIVARHAWRTPGKNGAPTFDLANTVEASIDEVGSFFGKKEAENFRAFAKTTKAIWDTVKEPFVVAQRPTAWSVLRDLSERGFGAALEIDGLRTLHQSLAARFDDPRLQQLFGRYATYCGSSPFAAPATLALVAHVEQEGVFHVAGGMRALANALYQLALRQGVTFQFETSVSEIVVRYGRVVGVRTNEATEVPAGLVVHAGDAQALATGLFGAEATRAVKAIEREDRSLSAYTFSMLARPSGHPLARHTVVFADDYAREFRELFSQRILPSEPTVYICAQDREAPVKVGPPSLATPLPGNLLAVANGRAPPLGKVVSSAAAG